MADSWDLIFEATQQDGWWMPSSVTQVERPEIRYTYDTLKKPGYSMVTRITPSLTDYTALVDEVIAHQRPTGESSFMLAEPSYTTALEKHLKSRGFSLRGIADCRSIDVAAPRPSIPLNIEVKRVETEGELRQMDAVMVACFEQAKPADEHTIQNNLAGCTGPDARCRRYLAYDSVTGQPLAAGSVNIFAEQGVGFMWGGATMPDARGRGVYSALVTARMKDAQEHGLQRIGLYALRTTSGPIIERQGFEKHGSVHFWIQKF